jgi:uncharacterized protein YndB with AHSA1/START domain
MDQKLGARAEAVFPTTPDRVWDAVATGEGFARVYQGIQVGGDWRPGGLVFWAGEWEGKTFRDEGTILEYDRPRVFSYTYWTSFWGPAPAVDEMVLIRNEFSAVPGGTRLVIVQSRNPTAETRDQSQKGWEDVLKKVGEFLK